MHSSPSSQTFTKLSWSSFALGLLVMIAMFLWSFHLENDFSGRYGTESFHRQFWFTFFIGIFFYAAGSAALGTLIKTQSAMFFGIGVILTGVALFQLIMPRVDFHGWTGASAYMLTIMLSSGGLLTFSVGGIRHLWRKFHSPYIRASD